MACISCARSHRSLRLLGLRCSEPEAWSTNSWNTTSHCPMRTLWSISRACAIRRQSSRVSSRTSTALSHDGQGSPDVVHSQLPPSVGVCHVVGHIEAVHRTLEQFTHPFDRRCQLLMVFPSPRTTQPSRLFRTFKDRARRRAKHGHKTPLSTRLFPSPMPCRTASTSRTPTTVPPSSRSLSSPVQSHTS